MSAPDWLLWLDLETTGLWSESDGILECACVLTGADLEPVWSREWRVCAPIGATERMTPFVREMHETNGLLGYTEPLPTPSEVESEILSDLRYRRIERGACVLAGNTIHFDRRFLVRWMPFLHEWLHYRMLDVSAVRHALRMWSPRGAEVEKLAAAKDAASSHRAMGDVMASIEEMRVYRDWLGRLPT